MLKNFVFRDSIFKTFSGGGPLFAWGVFVFPQTPRKGLSRFQLVKKYGHRAFWTPFGLILSFSLEPQQNNFTPIALLFALHFPKVCIFLYMICVHSHFFLALCLWFSSPFIRRFGVKHNTVRVSSAIHNNYGLIVHVSFLTTIKNIKL